MEANLGPADLIRAGNALEVARTITAIENGRADRTLMAELYRECGRAHLIGVTGPPGAGKSSLVAVLIRHFRHRGATIGVIAVDPSSPFSGGALLGDRDRMMDSALDSGVFIRSIASRGAGGGLALAVNDAIDVLDAMGKDVIIIETVGVGQGELDIARVAQSVLLVLVPGYGDALQAMKAGITEIADVVAVNKCDMPGADQTALDIHAQGLERKLEAVDAVWEVPVLKVSARRDEGVDTLVDALVRHHEFAERTGWARFVERARRRKQFADLVGSLLRDTVLEMSATEDFKAWSDRLDAGEVDPRTAASCLVDEVRDRLNAAGDITSRSSPRDEAEAPYSDVKANNTVVRST